MKLHALALSFSLLSLLAPSVLAQNGPPTAAVEVAEAQTRNIAPTVWVPGTVISRQDSRLAAELAGNLLWVAEVGDRVQKGQPLARLNSRLWLLEEQDNLADLARLDSNLVFLDKQVERNEALAKTNNASRSELERLTMEREMIRQQRRAAEVALARTRYDLERTEIRAPFDGVVVARFAQPAEHISAGQAVVRLTNTDNLEITAQAALTNARQLTAGTELAVKGAEQTQVATLRSLVPVGDERSRLLELRITAEASHWLIGEAVRVELPSGEAHAALTVPRDALVLREKQVYVFKVGDDNKAVRVPVIPGDGYGSRIAVEGELTEGDRVIVRGAERLQDGQLVNILRQHAATDGLADRG